ncbi:MAG: ferrochelatase, partial [Gemmatimonadota bacterium]
VMAYGTPRRLEDVEAYYAHIRRGSPPSRDLLEGLLGRYRAVGGPTRLNRITREQANALAAALGARGHGVPVAVGFKHVAPFVGDAVRELAGAGIGRVVGLVLAPHYSIRSIAEYERYAREAAPAGLEVDVIQSWHDHPGLIAFLAGRLRAALDGAGADPHVLFTAHSVPARVLDGGDPYPGQLRETSELVARAAGVARWSFAYQSAGRTAEAWLGPDVLDVISELAEKGETGVVVQSIGFVADHLEILYDLDVEAREAAERLGLRFVRADMPNAHPDFVAALADLVARRLAAPAEGTSAP